MRSMKPKGSSMIRRIWIPIVMVVVVVVGGCVVWRLHGVFGSHQRVSSAGNADVIVAFNPKHVLLEVWGQPAPSPTSTTWMPMLSRNGWTMQSFRGRS